MTGLERGKMNPFFSGGTVTVDGLVLHEHRLVYNTKGAASGPEVGFWFYCRWFAYAGLWFAGSRYGGLWSAWRGREVF